MPRASASQKAQRLNQARILLREQSQWSEAAQQLAKSCSISRRQAYRYLEQVQDLKKPVPVSDAKVAFTVKLSPTLVRQLRMYAASAKLTLSDSVAQALIAMLHRGRRRG
jgi:predicted DNA-binding transcriptional regulator YafY